MNYPALPILHRPHIRQQDDNISSAPAIMGRSATISARRSLPIPRRWQAGAPISNTNACTSIGTSTAAGDIGTIDPKGHLPPQAKHVGTRPIGPAYDYTPVVNAALVNQTAQLAYSGDAGTKIIPARMNSHPMRRRGYAGHIPNDCIPHDDYRSTDFIGPRVPA
jgi:hypothetical protein